MLGTLEMMKSIVTGKEKELSTEELVKQYQIGLNPNILAYLYIDNFAYIYRLAQKYPKLSMSDKASFCLQSLDTALRTYKFDKNTKFTTYFFNGFMYKLNSENKVFCRRQKKFNYTMVNFSECFNDYVEDLYFDNLDILNTEKLNKQEKLQGRLTYMGYSVKEIAKCFNLSKTAIYQRNKKIREILVDLV